MTGVTSEARHAARRDHRLAFAPALVRRPGVVRGRRIHPAHADWHGVPNAGNMLFLDGAVRFMTVKPRAIVGPMLFGFPSCPPRRTPSRRHRRQARRCVEKGVRHRLKKVSDTPPALTA